jgi:hypothetical protein
LTIVRIIGTAADFRKRLLHRILRAIDDAGGGDREMVKMICDPARGGLPMTQAVSVAFGT